MSREATDPDAHATGVTRRVLLEGNVIAWVVFCAALAQFLFFTWWTLDQPIVDGWGFRPAQTAISVPYMLDQGAWLTNIVPIFGEPWTLPLEFPVYQWCVALLTWVTGAPVGTCGRLVSAFFAVAALWPAFLLAEELPIPNGRRLVLFAGALWLLAPVTVFWGRAFLIETTVVFLSLGWLAFFVRFLTRRNSTNYLACLGFGVLAAIAKVTVLAGFIVAGFFYTCFYSWQKRAAIARYFPILMLAAATVALSAGALLVWSNYTDKQLAQNPLAALLRVQNMPSWYFGVWRDRWSFDLWGWAIRIRDLPEALGSFWLIPVVGLAFLCFLRSAFWVLLAIALVVSYLSVYLFFPILHINNPYYQLENVFLLCAAVAVVVGGLLQRGQATAGYAVLMTTALSQVWSLYAGVYGELLFVDFHKHPYYQAGRAVREATSPDSVVVVFGTGWGADVPYFAQRRGFVIANFFPVPLIHQMLFEQRERWFDGRKLGAMVDCAVYDNSVIAPVFQPIRDALKRELNGNAIDVVGLPYSFTISQPQCEIYTFSEDNIKPERPAAKPPVSVTDVVASLVTDPSTLGVTSSGWAPGGQCNIESIDRNPAGNDVIAVSKDRPFELAGWALNPERERLPQQVVVQLASPQLGNYFGLTRTGVMRDDVKSHFSLPDRFARSGFGYIANIQNVAAGNYHLRLLLQFADATYVCDNGRRVEVR